MDNSNVLNERQKIFGVDSQLSLIKQAEEHKLSLRKKEISNYISSKRLLRKQPQNPSFHINILTLDIPSELKNKKYSNSTELQQSIKTYLSSSNINEIKYAIHLLKFCSESINNSIIELFNNNIIAPLFTCLELHHNDHSICNESLLILISLYEIIDTSQSENAAMFIDVLLSKKAYYIWKSIFSYDIYELSTNVIFLLNLITYSYQNIQQSIIEELCKSDIMNEYIIPLLEKESTYIHAYNEHINNNKHCDLVNAALCLFGTIITNKGNNKNGNYDNNDSIIYKIIDIFLKYIIIQNESYLRYIFYGLSQLESLQSNSYFEYFAGNTLIIDTIINPQFQFPEYSKVIFYGHRALGNLFGVININKYYNNEYLQKIFNHLALYLTSKTFLIKQESAWMLSNMVVDCNDIVKLAIENDVLMKALVNYFEGINDQALIYEGVLVVQILITNADFNGFLRIMEYGFFNVIVEMMKKELSEFVVGNLFLCVINCLKRGEAIKEQIGGNRILQKFLEMGGREMVVKYMNCRDMELREVLEEIEKMYLNGEEDGIEKGKKNNYVVI